MVGSDDALSADDLVIGLSVGGTLKGGYYDGLLGAQFLSRYVVTIDYPNRLVTFEPRDQSERYDRFDRSGAFLITDAKNPDSIVVHEVVPASPADEAGLSAGDQLTQINGVPTKRLGLAHIRQIFASKVSQAFYVQFCEIKRRLRSGCSFTIYCRNTKGQELACYPRLVESHESTRASRMFSGRFPALRITP